VCLPPTDTPSLPPAELRDQCGKAHVHPDPQRPACSSSWGVRPRGPGPSASAVEAPGGGWGEGRRGKVRRRPGSGSSGRSSRSRFVASSRGAGTTIQHRSRTPGLTSADGCYGWSVQYRDRACTAAYRPSAWHVRFPGLSEGGEDTQASTWTFRPVTCNGRLAASDAVDGHLPIERRSYNTSSLS
jgi:hypothetical protein